MKEKFESSSEKIQLKNIVDILATLNQQYYTTKNTIRFSSSSSNSDRYLIEVLKESIQLGLIKEGRFDFNDGINQTLASSQIQLDTFTIDQNTSSLSSSQQLFEYISQFQCSVFIGGSAEISNTSPDKHVMENNVIAKTADMARSAHALLNGGIGRDNSIMRIAVTNYLRSGGNRYIAVLPEEYVQYELPTLQDLKKSMVKVCNG
jgi:hypothetical protein